MRLPAAHDRHLVEVLRALPETPARARFHAPAIVARAEAHGVAGVVHDAFRAATITLDPAFERALAWREAAREADHAAHLATLERLDGALSRAGLPAVVLKGALFGERFYDRPAARATSDIDLLVREAELESALEAVSTVGYIAATGAAEERFRREHHHLHCAHPSALPLELHFHAYRGFGRVLPSEPLVARRHVWRAGGFTTIGVLAPEDELVYLAVHAASHRFVRLGWLYDLRLLLRTMEPEQVVTAAARARTWGYARSLAFAADLLVDVLGVPASDVKPLERLGVLRRSVLRAAAGEPAGPWRRPATRFVYTIALCDTIPAAARYARSASFGHARRALGVP